MRTPMAIIAVLLAVLVPFGFATDDGPGGTAAEAARPSAPISVIAERVERIRGLRFESAPKPERVSAETAKREGLADLDRGYPVARRRADEARFTLLGLLPPRTDLREVSGSVFGEQVAGYYDPVRKTLRIVEGAGTANRVLDEMVIAHELDHALEDQAIGLETELADRTDDAGLAYRALVEGAATEVMYAYLGRHFESDVALGGIFGGALGQPSGGDLPPFVMAQLVFPYTAGQEFAAFLLRRAGRRWDLVDLAERTRPPTTTEQVLHPRKWLEVEQPLPVRLPGLRRRLGDGWERLASGRFGEWQKGQLLGRSGRAGAEAAAGWGGDRYELWRRGGRGPCAAPCAGRDVLVMRWRWDTARDRAEFATAIRGYVRDGLEGRPAGRDRWTSRGGAVVVREHAGGITLAFAPDLRTAARVAH